MLHKLSDEKVIFAFDKNTAPVLTVASGDSVMIRTKDCFGNQLQTSTDTPDSLDWDNVNPATGPIFVKDAQPGDVLKVELLELTVDNQASMLTGEDEGTCGDLFKGLSSTLSSVKDGRLIWDDKLSLAIKPMVGVIGVAPTGDPINCGTPGHHGGNMDNTMIGQNTILYFPVATPGALFACGDVHAVMGDGEIGVCGAEIASHLKVRLTVIKNRKITNPVLMSPEKFTTIASAPTFDEAADIAVHDMVALLHEQIDMPLDRLVMLLSLCADVQVCQIVDPYKTARYVISRDILQAYGFTW